MCHTWGALGGALGGALPLDCHSLVYPPAYCTFGFRETIFLGIIEFYPGYGGFVTFEGELVPKLVSELAADF